MLSLDPREVLPSGNLYRELLRWRAAHGVVAAQPVTVGEVVGAEHALELSFPDDLLVFVVGRDLSPNDLVLQTELARADGVPDDVIVVDSEDETYWCVLPQVPPRVLAWSRSQERFLPGSISLAELVQLDMPEHDGSDTIAALDSRFAFQVRIVRAKSVA